MPELKILENNVPVKVLPLTRDLVLGKSADADVTLDRRNISRKHCRVFQQDGKWCVRGLGECTR